LQGQTSEVQRRREGDTLYIQCPYAGWGIEWQTKYWCLLKNGRYEHAAYTYYGSQNQNGRIQIQDKTTNKTVSITMTDLKAEDSGTYFCTYHGCAYPRLKTISLNVFQVWDQHTPGVLQGPSSAQPRSQAPSLSCDSTFIIVTVVLLILLLLALITSTALGVRYYKLLARTGNREAEDTRDRSEGTAQPGSTGRRKSSQDDSQGSGYINLDVQSQPSPEDPLYCNVEPSQAARSPPGVEYALIAFSRPQEQQG
ncbi:TRML2 protein, partial [Oenanthe oenanthe]|nr:TRML2 protein [Oenanthe oenanthe]